MRYVMLLGVLAACEFTGRSTGDDTGDDDDGPDVPTCSTDVAGALAGLRVPGVSAAIVKHGAVACTAVAGSARIETDQAVTPDTIFAWASVSKTVTATAAMMLYDEGRFGLDDNIDDYLPFAVENPNCAGTPITFRQLMTHTSSILDNVPVYEASYTIGDSPIALGDFVRGYVEPGGAYYDADENFADECSGTIDDYSNVAIGLLGYLVEQIAGQPFDQFCRDRIFAPLGMTDTSFRLADLDEANVAMPYDRSNGHFVAHGHNGFPTYPDGLLRASVPHLARFLAMNADLGDLGGMRILAEPTAREMRRIQVPDLDDTQGLIWFYDDFGTHLDLLGHDGDDPGTSSLMFYDPATGDGALLVANGYWYDANEDSPEADAVLAALFDEAGRLP